jgi:hypothetical protein
VSIGEHVLRNALEGTDHMLLTYNLGLLGVMLVEHLAAGWGRPTNVGPWMARHGLAGSIEDQPPRMRNDAC